jgi:DNA-binding NtrC family response regulator
MRHATARLSTEASFANPLENPDGGGESKLWAVRNVDGIGPLDAFLEAFPLESWQLREQLRRVAPQETTLLLTGETGTGKTRLARLVHELSPRHEEPFLVVDCGALSADLIESELFGHVKGAFTGADRDRPGKLAAASGGTLLLEEINSLPPPLQAKLLRAVDERVFEPVGANQGQRLRARLVAASNAPLEEEVTAGRFRADLFYRLNVVSFHLPPLRERPATVAPLARKFLAEFMARNRPDLRRLADEAMALLEGYSWPGNIRQLRNVIERAAALCPGPDVLSSDLPETIRCPTLAAAAASTSAPTRPAPLPSSSPPRTPCKRACPST